MRGHLQAVGKEPPKPGSLQQGTQGWVCAGTSAQSLPAWGTQTAMDHPNSARSPETIHSPKNTLSSPSQCPSTAVPETSCIASSCSASWLLSSLLEQLQQPEGIKMHQGNSTSVLGLWQQGSGLQSIFLPVRMGEQ